MGMVDKVWNKMVANARYMGRQALEQVVGSSEHQLGLGCTLYFGNDIHVMPISVT